MVAGAAAGCHRPAVAAVLLSHGSNQGGTGCCADLQGRRHRYAGGGLSIGIMCTCCCAAGSDGGEERRGGRQGEGLDVPWGLGGCRLLMEEIN